MNNNLESTNPSISRVLPSNKVIPPQKSHTLSLHSSKGEAKRKRSDNEEVITHNTNADSCKKKNKLTHSSVIGPKISPASSFDTKLFVKAMKLYSILEPNYINNHLKKHITDALYLEAAHFFKQLNSPNVQLTTLIITMAIFVNIQTIIQQCFYYYYHVICKNQKDIDQACTALSIIYGKLRQHVDTSYLYFSRLHGKSLVRIIQSIINPIFLFINHEQHAIFFLKKQCFDNKGKLKNNINLSLYRLLNAMRYHVALHMKNNNGFNTIKDLDIVLTKRACQLPTQLGQFVFAGRMLCDVANDFVKKANPHLINELEKQCYKNVRFQITSDNVDALCALPYLLCRTVIRGAVTLLDARSFIKNANATLKQLLNALTKKTNIATSITDTDLSIRYMVSFHCFKCSLPTLFIDDFNNNTLSATRAITIMKDSSWTFFVFNKPKWGKSLGQPIVNSLLRQLWLNDKHIKVDVIINILNALCKNKIKYLEAVKKNTQATPPLTLVKTPIKGIVNKSVEVKDMVNEVTSLIASDIVKKVLMEQWQCDNIETSVKTALIVKTYLLEMKEMKNKPK